jgi:hypothetical protein
MAEISTKIILETIVKGAENATKSLSNISKSITLNTDAAKKFTAGMAVAATAMVYFGKKAIEAYQKQESAEKRLVQIATQVTGATENQIQGYKDLAREMQKTGVMGDEVIISGQSQLASFTKSADVVTLLSKSMADLSVAQYGVNVSQDQAIQSANMLGKAMTGQLGAMTRAGVLVSAEYKKAFE